MRLLNIYCSSRCNLIVIWAVIDSFHCTSPFTIIHLSSHNVLLNLLLATDTEPSSLLIAVPNPLSTVYTQSVSDLLPVLFWIIQNFTRTTVLY